jgi:hypothetical protein
MMRAPRVSGAERACSSWLLRSELPGSESGCPTSKRWVMRCRKDDRVFPVRAVRLLDERDSRIPPTVG